MNIVQRIKTNPRILISIGLLFLAASIAWPRFIGFTPHLGDVNIDGFRGFLSGIALGLELLGLRTLSRRRGNA